MQLTAIQRIVGLLIMLFSLTMLPPLAVSWLYADGAQQVFTWSMVLMLVIGYILWVPVKHNRGELRTREGFLIVVLFWGVLGLFGALPFALSTTVDLSVTEAVFESMSGLTTTGATILTEIESLPKSLLWYRQQLQWLGGLGVIVLAVALFPMLGVGGMQLYRAETPGPMKDNKLTPRIAHTARALWYIYLGLTLACTLAYWLAGMNVFDALAHSLTTVSTGGFSTYNASLGHFDSPLIDTIAIVFMLAGGINFAVQFVAWHYRDIREIFKDAEVRAFLTINGALVVLVTLVLVWTTYYQSPIDALRYSAFQVVSIITSTGFTTTDFSVWPLFLPILLITISFIGGCAGSTAGGMKVIRIILLYKQGVREVTRLVHPSAVIPVKVGGKPMEERVIDSVWGFFSLYTLSTVVLTMAMMATGLDAVSAYSSVAAAINVLGPGLGDVAANFASVTPTGKWILTFAMLLGRLEIFTLLVLFSPVFWKK